MKLRPIHFLLLFTAVAMVWVSSNVSWAKTKYNGILESDARGYYAYLPAVFIYNDLNFDFFESVEKVRYYDEHYTYEYRVRANDKYINKYWCGTAICQLPFFLAAHAVTKITNCEVADGYSRYYPVFINIGAICFLLLGIYCCDKFLARFGISDGNRVFACIAIVFATNLFYYTAIEPGMSHVFSFGLISFFLLTFSRLADKFSPKQLYIASATLGVIFLTRPQNLLIVPAVLIVFSDRTHFLRFMSGCGSQFKSLLIAAGLFFAVASLQFIIYRISCGKYFVDSYPGESFNFSDPHVIDILFSYKKGLFLYTPVYLLCIAGIIYMLRQSRWRGLIFILHFLLITYVFSSWHNWWYGGSFSSRVYIEYLPLFALPFAFMLQRSSQKVRGAVLTLTAVLLVFCQIQTYQYRYNQIHWDSMTKEKYWDVFMRVDRL